MKRVIIESPYAAAGVFTVAVHTAYARLAMWDSLSRGEAPFLSHLLYTQTLDDALPAERATGIAAGLAWAAVADMAAVYCDLGFSRGMAQGIGAHRLNNVPCVLRRLFSSEVGKALRAGTLRLPDAVRLQ